jgi:hypothetical protein
MCGEVGWCELEFGNLDCQMDCQVGLLTTLKLRNELWVLQNWTWQSDI